MKNKKLLYIGLLGLTTITLAACGSSSNTEDVKNLPDSRFNVSVDEPSWKKDTDYDAKLKWYVNFDWYNSDWGSDVVSKKIKEDMNIEVEFINGNDERLNTMLAGGDLPDIITFDKNLKAAASASRFALPLNQLSEKYDPYFMANAAKPETLKWYTEEDGNIYGYPSFSTTKQDYEDGNVRGDQVFIVRKDIYEGIGSPDMSTPDGFLKALSEAKKFKPKTDTGSDLVPFAGTALDIANGGDGAFGWVLQDFLSIPLTDGDKLFDRDADEDYILWLDTFRQAYNDGLMTSEQFSDNDNTIKEKLSQGRYFAFLHSNTKGLTEFMSDNNARNREQEYIAIDGPKNSKGDQSVFSGGNIGGWTQTFITKDTKEPQKAIELLTYLTSEYGTMVNSFGVEGETYTLENDKAVLTPEIQNLKDTDIPKFDKQIALGTYWQMGNDNYAISKGLEPADSIIQMVEWSTDKIEPRFEMEDIDPKEGTIARNANKIQTDKVKAIVDVIQSSTKQEGLDIWDTFLSERESNGYSELQEYRNQRMNENLKKMQ